MNTPLSDALKQTLSKVRSGRVVVLTGAGISAESGIPTFRGKEGYWRIGSRDYQPQEIATWAMFSQHPDQVWPWYLYRRAVCRAAEPNSGHLALVDLERAFEERFVLVTQNVDGLHMRAGNSFDRTWQIHGNVDYMRCATECSNTLLAVPDGMGSTQRSAEFEPQWRNTLSCPRCGGWTRPHVLWFDECYDEARYRYESSIEALQDADLLVVVGTTGTTSLPAAMGQIAVQRDIPIIDINPTANPFSRLAQQSTGGAVLAAPSGSVLPDLVRYLVEA